jgi:hypothetical protein
MHFPLLPFFTTVSGSKRLCPSLMMIFKSGAYCLAIARICSSRCLATAYEYKSSCSTTTNHTRLYPKGVSGPLIDRSRTNLFKHHVRDPPVPPHEGQHLLRRPSQHMQPLLVVQSMQAIREILHRLEEELPAVYADFVVPYVPGRGQRGGAGGGRRTVGQSTRPGEELVPYRKLCGTYGIERLDGS